MVLAHVQLAQSMPFRAIDDSETADAGTAAAAAAAAASSVTGAVPVPTAPAAPATGHGVRGARTGSMRPPAWTVPTVSASLSDVDDDEVQDAIMASHEAAEKEKIWKDVNKVCLSTRENVCGAFFSLLLFFSLTLLLITGIC